jgi:hypothetical protein
LHILPCILEHSVLKSNVRRRVDRRLEVSLGSDSYVTYRLDPFHDITRLLHGTRRATQRMLHIHPEDDNVVVVIVRDGDVRGSDWRRR